MESSWACSEHPLSGWAEAAVADATLTNSAGETEMALECLAQLRPAGAARAFFESLATAQSAPERQEERRRRQVGLVLALGRAAEDDACQAALEPRSPGVALVATRSLAQLGTRRATECYLDAASRGNPDARAAAAANLNFLALNLHISPGDAFDAAARLARDSDPVVRAAAASSLVLFDERTARKLPTPLATDPESTVRAAAGHGPRARSLAGSSRRYQATPSFPRSPSRGAERSSGVINSARSAAS